MNNSMLWTALSALSLVALSEGCWGPPDDESLGKLCAAATNGAWHCVRSNHGPEEAWNQAAKDGEMPIKMWAQTPDDVTLDEVVASREKLQDWFADMDTVASFVRDEKRNAESYRETLDDGFGWDLWNAVRHQEALLADKAVPASDNFKAALQEKANAEKGPLLAAIAADTRSMRAVHGVLEEAKRAMTPLQERFAGIAAEFAAYKATEATETTAYAALAQQASASTLATIDGIEQDILAAGHEASGRPNDLATRAMQVSAELREREIRFQAAIAPHVEFLATHGAALPDMTSGALRSLNAMLGYVQRRVARSDATATSLLRGVAMRREALLLLQSDEATRSAAARSRLGRASSVFADGARARVEAIERALPTSAKLRLPYLAARHDQLRALLQLRPLCEASSSASWRDAGCATLRARFSEAQATLATGLPRLIAAGLSTMRAGGVDAALLDAARARLDAGDVERATMAYDAAVRSSEGT